MIALSAATFRPLFRKESGNDVYEASSAPAIIQVSDESSHPSYRGKKYDIEFSTAFYDTKSTIPVSHLETSKSSQDEDIPWETSVLDSRVSSTE